MAAPLSYVALGFCESHPPTPSGYDIHEHLFPVALFQPSWENPLMNAYAVLGETTKILPSLPDLATPWSGVAGELMQSLLFLLPGLVTVAIINSLTVRQKLEPLERVIQALLYTFVNHVTWQIFLWIINTILFVCSWGHESWVPSAKAQLIWLAIAAIFWGIIVTSIINIGWLHDRLRDLAWIKIRLNRLRDWCHKNRLPLLARAIPTAMWFGITKRSSRPSEWYDAFYDADNQFVVVHLKDGRRIYGWAHLYPDLPTEGHLLICDAEWLTDEPHSPKRPLVRILLAAADVQFIEFIEVESTEKSNEQSTIEVLPNGDTRNSKEGRRESEAGGPTSSGTTSAAGT
jgi:hypothetical protein